MKQTPSLEARLRDALSRQIALKLQDRLINGSNETDTWRMDGIEQANVAANRDVNASADVLTHNKILDRVETLELKNIGEEQIRFIISPHLKKFLKQIYVDPDAKPRGTLLQNGQLSGQPLTICSDIKETVDGSDKVSNMYYGAWDRGCLLINYGAAQIDIDPNYSFKDGKIGMRIWYPFGFLLRDDTVVRYRTKVKHATA